MEKDQRSREGARASKEEALAALLSLNLLYCCCEAHDLRMIYTESTHRIKKIL
jgi:hypothetical protein